MTTWIGVIAAVVAIIGAVFGAVYWLWRQLSKTFKHTIHDEVREVLQPIRDDVRELQWNADRNTTDIATLRDFVMRADMHRMMERGWIRAHSPSIEPTPDLFFEKSHFSTPEDMAIVTQLVNDPDIAPFKDSPLELAFKVYERLDPAVLEEWTRRFRYTYKDGGDYSLEQALIAVTAAVSSGITRMQDLEKGGRAQ